MVHQRLEFRNGSNLAIPNRPHERRQDVGIRLGQSGHDLSIDLRPSETRKCLVGDESDVSIGVFGRDKQRAQGRGVADPAHRGDRCQTDRLGTAGCGVDHSLKNRIAGTAISVSVSQDVDDLHDAIGRGGVARWLRHFGRESEIHCARLRAVLEFAGGIECHVREPRRRRPECFEQERDALEAPREDRASRGFCDPLLGDARLADRVIEGQSLGLFAGSEQAFGADDASLCRGVEGSARHSHRLRENCSGLRRADGANRMPGSRSHLGIRIGQFGLEHRQCSRIPADADGVDHADQPQARERTGRVSQCRIGLWAGNRLQCDAGPGGEPLVTQQLREIRNCRGRPLDRQPLAGDRLVGLGSIGAKHGEEFGLARQRLRRQGRDSK